MPEFAIVMVRAVRNHGNQERGYSTMHGLWSTAERAPSLLPVKKAESIAADLRVALPGHDVWVIKKENNYA